MTFPVLYADPPWHFETRTAAGRGRTADAWYDTMTLPELRAFPLGDYAAPDCVLLCWVIDPFLEVAQDLIRAWGFKFKTVGFYWVKTNKNGSYFKGLGHWSRGNPEQCWLATRGRPARLSGNVDKLIVAPRREHSRKPEEAYDRIEALVAGPYLELFARGEERPNWTRFGNQTGLFADGGAPVRRWRSDMREIPDA